MLKEKEALLVIDAQIGPMWETFKRDETYQVMKTMISEAEQREVTIFYLQFESTVKGDAMTRGSQVWNFFPGITPRSQDVIIPKTAADSFFQTSLEDELRQRNISHLYVVGVRTDYCIDTTCRVALSLGFTVTLVSDGHTTIDDTLSAEEIINHHNRNLSKLSTGHHTITVKPSSEILAECTTRSFLGDEQ